MIGPYDGEQRALPRTGCLDEELPSAWRRDMWRAELESAVVTFGFPQIQDARAVQQRLTPHHRFHHLRSYRSNLRPQLTNRPRNRKDRTKSPSRRSRALETRNMSSLNQILLTELSAQLSCCSHPQHSRRLPWCLCRHRLRCSSASLRRTWQ